MIFTYIVNRLGGYFELRERYLNTNSNIIKKFCLMINKGFQQETNSYLPFETLIKGPINFLHGTSGVFISNNALIGVNCTMFQQVTIGSNMLKDSKRFGSPIIGDNCLIGAGAKIIGKVKVGNNCRIGANAVVVKDLPDNSVVVLSASLIYLKENLDNRVYQFTKKGWGYNFDGKFIVELDSKTLSFLDEHNKD